MVRRVVSSLSCVVGRGGHPISKRQGRVRVISTLGWWHYSLQVCTHIFSCGLPLWDSEEAYRSHTPCTSWRFNHLLALFSQDLEWASAGRDPERVPPSLGGKRLPSPVLLQDRKAVEKTCRSPATWKCLPPLTAFQGWTFQHCLVLPLWPFHCQLGPAAGS